ncbi:membrane protein [Ophiostoma piceae UAMH 11346]|uniref:Membrane protein n=1 Tax=Ophiostoma piceae (strain UAMH 11346) TaxID=1262450 RepID=S3CEW9_OPHP1|nr:membrane protein [Ophiostoma piceae UAMH 11346]
MRSRPPKEIDVEMVDAADDSDDWEDDAGSVASETPSWVLNESGMPERDFRLKSVYDAVAGRVRVHEVRAPKWAGASTRYLDTILTPEEALYRSSGAPDRFEETDTYFAHEELPAGALPDSDLVKSVHHYASQYYEVLALREKRAHDAETKRARALQKTKAKEKATQRQTVAAAGGRKEKRKAATALEEDVDNKEDASETDTIQKFVYSRQRLLDERSMDETALIAFGILLEEAGRQALGENGDLVFTEPAEEEEEEGGEGEEATEKQKKEEKGKQKRRVTDVKSGMVYDESSDD